MPFEMIRGRRGHVLVAVLPMERGSFAEVTTYRLSLRLIHPEGVIINKWPALVPDYNSLSDHTRQTLAMLHDEKLAGMIDHFKRTMKREPGSDQIREMKRWLNRPMTCVNVGLGNPLIASLPPKPFGSKGQFDFGTITAITIHNKGKAPVSVES